MDEIKENENITEDTKAEIQSGNSEEPLSRKEDIQKRKQKIRDRYRKAGDESIIVIPAKKQESIFHPDKVMRVGVYARVSTDGINQTSSYELQRKYYEELVAERENWTLVDIYADEGISGTSLKHRDNFVRMIQDCKAGKMDLIIVKNVARFARNIVDCIGYCRELKALPKPVGVFFESEHIYTLQDDSEMSLSFIATMAQEESHVKSNAMNASVDMRFKMGLFLTPVLLGYDHDEDGNLVINEDEAATVRFIFFSYLYGYTAQNIADALTDLERKTKLGNTTWSSGSVLGILTNERYCGDVEARKTYTPNYLDHKSKRNIDAKPRYWKENHHDAIISRVDFFAVQKMIRNAKYGNKGYFPEMHVVKSGLLSGFVTIHPKWAGFTTDDYYQACNCVEKEQKEQGPIQYEVKKGSIDLSGYELVRAHFMTSYGRMEVTITPSHVLFNKACINRLPKVYKIELLINPYEKKLAIRPGASTSRLNVEWCRNNGSERLPKIISGSAFLPQLYSLLGWEEECQYKVLGQVYGKGEEQILMFDLSDAVLLYVDEEEEYLDEKNEKKRMRKMIAYPAEWADSFGEGFYKSEAVTEYETSFELKPATENNEAVYSLAEEGVTTNEEAAKQIKNVLKTIGADNG